MPTLPQPWRIAAVTPTEGKADALDVWDASWPPGGYVCAECGTPTESEPCAEHQPNAYAAIT